MFRIKQKLDNIYDLIINLNNKERQHTKATENLMRSYERDNIKLSEELDNAKVLLKLKNELLDAERKNGMILRDVNFELNKEIEKLTNLLKEKKQESLKHSEFVRKTTERLLEQQEKELNRKKPTKVDLMTEKMNKISDEAKAKLK